MDGRLPRPATPARRRPRRSARAESRPQQDHRPAPAMTRGMTFGTVRHGWLTATIGHGLNPEPHGPSDWIALPVGDTPAVTRLLHGPLARRLRLHRAARRHGRRRGAGLLR